VLADPAEPGIAGKRFLQNWRAIDKGAVTKGTDLGSDALCKLLQATSQDLVIIPAQGVT
jgi:hypothetical protein